MDKILDKLDSMPADLWLLLIAIPVLIVACVLLRIAKRHRYKDFDKDGDLFVAARLGVGMDSSDAGDGLFDVLRDDGSHH